MNQVDWNTYKFHCSSIKSLMVTPRLKSETLSETTKSFLRQIYIKEVFGRVKTEMIANKFVRKGTMCETDSIALFEEVTGEKHFKNNKTIENDYVIGTPDVIAKDKILDIKTSWDLFTFFDVDRDKATDDYYYQLLGYMWLTGKDKAELAYCLVDTPEELINDEIYRLKFYMPEEEAEEFRINFMFGDIAKEKRVKKYLYEYNGEMVEAIQNRIEDCRAYLMELATVVS